MATRLVEVNGDTARSDIKQFMCLTVDEIAKLPREGVPGTLDESGSPGLNDPCGIGSQAIIKTGEIYLLWPDNNWAPF